ncbi:MAG: phosphotransferase family protein [Desulfobacterales bacterium]|nr:phosphotransferase family protein [Desulfobacterales bacterium]
MELDALQKRLVKFCRAKYEDDGVSITNVHKMPGHAGFSYGFTVECREKAESWYLRLPPPNVKWKGTADVLRQVTVLNALDETDIPHCSVKWSGDDLQWFDRPFFIVPKLEGDVLRLQPAGWEQKLSEEQVNDLGRQIMTALVKIHRIDWEEKTPGLGPPIPFEKDVVRWDRFLEHAADPERLTKVPEVRSKLLANLPTETPIGIFHGDYQGTNMFCSFEGNLLAVVDWELVGIGATLNDVGWLVTFNDPKAWSTEGNLRRERFFDPDTLVKFYIESYGSPLPDIRWFRALAAYKFAIISGLNLMLHRTGKRPDPHWEELRYSMNTLIDRALELLY